VSKQNMTWGRLLIAAASLLTVAAMVLLVITVTGDDESGDSNATQETSEIPGGADAEAAEVIDNWSTALREGDIEAAAEFFAVPSVAQNGTPPLDLDSREDVVTFNEALPCGAELVEATDHAGFTIATFELTERPGEGQCGPGVGETAQTAFRIEDGLITEWRRVGGDGLPEPDIEGPVV
jgi:hypothetical protein